MERFGADNVYRDLDSTAPGADFAEVIAQTIGRCDALVAVIGRDWGAVTHQWRRRRRHDDSQDWVLREIAVALQRNVRVVPVLVEGAKMPRPDELPEDVQMFAWRHAVELSETVWALQLDRLMDSLTAEPAAIAHEGDSLRILPASARRRRGTMHSLRRPRAAAAVIMACGLGIAAYTIVPGDGGETGVDSSAVKAGALPAAANSLSESEYRVQATGICAEYRDQSTRITEAEGVSPQLGSHLQLETRITKELKALRPPRRLAAGHRKVLALWGRRLTIMGYEYDTLRRELSDPAYRRKLARYNSEVNDLATQIDQAFVGLHLTPECSLRS